ncbi:MATE family efflux transporter [Oscillibacter hominis]|uniref:Probable multidrug resistance protein NorM n=1 Tax=Oscillibacter hominis TaxID=2763056 RepID=A0A7G9B6I1_9FIRM|nr:MATE family efflux transporter [Oscillibacter hominis]QNL45162.1 MATE family efflux transporter [Oscillibacter hominis]
MDAIEFYGKEKISKILLKLAPPVMLAQLIQALYNIIDSLFIGRFSDNGLTALSIVYPLQLLMIALAVGTGVGINTVIAAKLGEGRQKEANEYAGVGTPLAVVLWFIFALICWAIMPTYARMSTESEPVVQDVITYGRIVCVFSFGLFLESIWTKVLQANGDMKTPMIAQIVGAVTNILLDPLLIFGMFGLPRMGIAGAAIATVAGQIVAALIVMKKGYRPSPAKEVYPLYIARIFRLGTPSILMQSAYTFYILGLNLILAGFCDQAVTALGLYYKWQTFFFIPLNAMQTCIVPIISFNYAARNIDRCKKTLMTAIGFGLAMMVVGTLCFVSIPGPMLRVFTADPLVIEIGCIGFRFVGISFLPLVTSLTFPVFFQAVGYSLKSTALTVIRTVVLFVPLGYVFSRFGLTWFWMTFPVTEIITSIAGIVFYRQFLEADYVKHRRPELPVSGAAPALQPSKPGVIITIARQHGSSGKQIGKLVAQRLGIPFYYKEMIALAAHESGLDAEFISDIHKNSPDVLRDLYLSTGAVRHAIRAQEKIIRRIADNGSCVIVGRAAGYVLRDQDNVVRVFIHAPKNYRIRRVMEIYGDTPKEARQNILRSDKARGAYYRHISGKRWGDGKNYQLVLDSSVGIDKTVETIVNYISEK